MVATALQECVFSDETSGRGFPKDQRVPFKVSTYKQFNFSKTNQGRVVVKDFIDGLTTSSFTFKKNNDIPQLLTVKAYLSGKVPINKKKIDDLKKLIPCTVGYESVYSKIFQWPTTEAECNVDREFEDEYFDVSVDELSAAYGLRSLECRRRVADISFLYRLINCQINCFSLLEMIRFRIPTGTRQQHLFELSHAARNYLRHSPIPRLMRH
ncbi:hypothetical protein J6590_086482 [Homalodisca vitripennis]|nr:hypothetical protein J6590_086482 [Homalodisca vitripennis]